MRLTPCLPRCDGLYLSPVLDDFIHQSTHKQMGLQTNPCNL
ncbi:rCG31708 [Rattus norvegicus]|uniref:RCG31708 n=1 Tax=Rattus norvegicus TaxID=10116 RepID=A6JN20_RAT|nr:rCG31708 [Rattus norvegicus]